jgi:hypothetical protein
MRLLRMAAVVVAALLLPVGCTGRPHASASAASEREDPNTVPADFSQMIGCFRAHGLPGFPDPAYDPRDGRWHFADDSPPLSAQVRQACASVMPQSTPASPIPTAQLNDLLQYARCVRAHGMPDWPDPAIDGVFHTSIDPKTDPRAVAAMQPCERYLAGSGGKLSLGQPNG